MNGKTAYLYLMLLLGVTSLVMHNILELSPDTISAYFFGIGLSGFSSLVILTSLLISTEKIKTSFDINPQILIVFKFLLVLFVSFIYITKETTTKAHIDVFVYSFLSVFFLSLIYFIALISYKPNASKKLGKVS